MQELYHFRIQGYDIEGKMIRNIVPKTSPSVSWVRAKMREQVGCMAASIEQRGHQVCRVGEGTDVEVIAPGDGSYLFRMEVLQCLGSDPDCRGECLNG